MRNNHITIFCIVAALATVCHAVIRIDGYYDPQCGWEYQGPARFSAANGECAQVMLADQEDTLAASGGNSSAVKIVGQIDRLVNSTFFIENYDDPSCQGPVVRLLHNLDTCLNLTDARQSRQIIGVDFAIFSRENVTDTEQMNNASNIIYASAIYYNSLGCNESALPYPITFIPGQCYTNITQLFPMEVSLLTGAQYPPVFPLQPVIVTLSKGFVNFNFFIDPTCTIFHRTSQSLSYPLGACTVLSRSSAVLVTVNKMEPVADVVARNESRNRAAENLETEALLASASAPILSPRLMAPLSAIIAVVLILM